MKWLWPIPPRTLALVSGLSIFAVLVTIVAATIVLAPPPGPQRATGRTSPAVTAPATATTASATAAPGAIPPGNDWAQYRYDVAGTGVNPEGSINSSNVAKLQTAWVVTDVYGWHPFESTPAVVDGVIYETAGTRLNAIDLLTGKGLWQFNDDGQPGTLFSSVAVDKKTGLAVYGAPDGRVFAVNIHTHTSAWVVKLGDPTQGANVWSSPLIVNGKVYIGLASTDDNPCVRGNVTAIDLASGHVLWQNYTVPAGELGGGVWSSVTADVAAGEIIATTGNPCDDPTGTSPQGGQVDSQQDAIVAMDWNTGNTVWKYSTLQYDTCDCDFGEGAAIFTYKQSEYIVAGNKAGVVYALKPPTSPGGSPTLAWKQTITKADFLGDGGIFQPPSYSNGMVFVAGGPTLDGQCAQGALWALRADTGSTVWRVCTQGQLVGAATVSGDVLLTGMENEVVALSTATGKTLWHANQKPGQAWGGTVISHGFVLSPMVGGPNGNSGQLFCYRLPAGAG
jgi:outer membrane protein assembly factor BamB